jgi:hypothetical protein
VPVPATAASSWAVQACCGAVNSSSVRRSSTTDELIITTITHDHSDRVRSYELLAREWQRRD